MAVVSALYSVAHYAHGTELDLEVSATEIVARGNVGRLFSKEIWLAVSEIVSISYRVGGEEQPSGLYASGPWKSTCIAPEVSEQLCGEILDALWKRFPQLAVGDPNPNSLLFGESGDPIQLKLSGPGEKS